MILSNQAYQTAASRLRCEVAAIKAVDTVESNGGGMIKGRPVILFEPHIFWKELKKAGIDPNKYVMTHGDMLYPVWGTKPYPKGQDAQHARLARAVEIHRDAALKSCSWGRFQICGFNWKATGSTSLQDFINRIYQGDEEHLEMFVTYIDNANLEDELQNKDWHGFARAYNGPLYTKHQYHIKLARAYGRHRKV